MKTLTIVIDENAHECLYIDGTAWEFQCEVTVYACDIASAAGDEPVRIVHQPIEFYHDQWPDKLDDALVDPKVLRI